DILRSIAEAPRAAPTKDQLSCARDEKLPPWVVLAVSEAPKIPSPCPESRPRPPSPNQAHIAIRSQYTVPDAGRTHTADAALRRPSARMSPSAVREPLPPDMLAVSHTGCIGRPATVPWAIHKIASVPSHCRTDVHSSGQ